MVTFYQAKVSCYTWMPTCTVLLQLPVSATIFNLMMKNTFSVFFIVLSVFGAAEGTRRKRSVDHCVRASDPNGDGVFTQSDDSDCTQYYECYPTYHTINRCPCPMVWQQSSESCIDYTCRPDESEVSCTLAVIGNDLALYNKNGVRQQTIESGIRAAVFDPFMDRLVFATPEFLKDCNTNGTDVERVCDVGVVNDDLAMGNDLFLVSANQVYFVDPVGTDTRLMVTAPSNIRDIRYNPNDKNLYYLTSAGQPAVLRFNPADNPVEVFSIRTSGTPEHLAINVDENKLIYNVGSNLYQHDLEEDKEELITDSFPSVSALVAYKNKIYDVRDGNVETRMLDGSVITSFPVPAAVRLEVFGDC